MPVSTRSKARKLAEHYQDRNLSSRTLLDLPPEIRNHIYRFTLLEQATIEVSNRSQPPLPALLMVNRQTRAEATSLYYREDKFKFVIIDHDSTILQKWYAAAKIRKTCTSRYKIHRSTNWDNLLQWMQAFYEKKTGGRHPGQRFDGAPCLNYSLFRMVKRMQNEQKLSWNK